MAWSASTWFQVVGKWNISNEPMSASVTESANGRRTAALPDIVKLTAPSSKGVRTVRYWLSAEMQNLLGSPIDSQCLHFAAVFGFDAVSSPSVAVGSSGKVRINSG